MRIHGVDPSSDYTGHACLVPRQGRNGPPELVVLQSIRMPDPPDRRLREVFLPHVRSGHRGDLWVIERPPPAAKRDAGHGWQAAIGYHTGNVGGMVAGLVLSGELEEPPLRVQPGPWRASMLALSMAWGHPLAAASERLDRNRSVDVAGPITRAPDGGFNLTWRTCSHVWFARDLGHLQRKPDQCPECGHETKSRADRVREAWKECAVEFVRTWWGDKLEPHVEAARARALKKDGRPAHLLAGIADMCEAAGVACHALVAFESALPVAV